MNIAVTDPLMSSQGPQPELLTCPDDEQGREVEMRVYAKDGDSRIRFISDGISIEAELIDTAICDDQEKADLVAEACCFFSKAAGWQADDSGWHHVPKLDRPLRQVVATLLNAARTKVWEGTPTPELVPEATSPPQAPITLAEPEQTSTRQTWDLARVAWLGFLVGRGKSAKAIADDPIIRSTPGNVFRQVHRFGLSLSAAPHGDVSFGLPAWAIAKIDRAAAVGHLQRDAFVQRLVLNALRDGYGTVAIK